MTRNLVVCCDGTWNTPEQKEGGLPAPTNVVKLYNLCPSDDNQLTYYHPGVGTNGGLIDKVFGGGMGAGLTRNIQSAYAWLCRNYASGDRIFLFGFSRGAYTARSLGGFVARCGLLDADGLASDELWARIGTLYDVGYRQRKPAAKELTGYAYRPGPLPDGKVDIHLIGVWDTVGALGVPDDMVLLDQLLDDPRQYRFHDTELSPSVRHARHAMAMDEMRASFAPTLWTDVQPPADGSVRQLWFAGTHSDVGGGHVQCGLSDGALQWMVDEAVAVGLRVNPVLLTQIRPDPQGVLHDSATGIWEHLRTLPRAVPAVIAANVGMQLARQVWERHSAPPISQAPYWPSTVLAPGGQRDIDIFARQRWNATGLYLEAGVAYEFAARGEWLDSNINCGPDGCGDGSFQLGEVAQAFGSALGELEKLYKKWSKKAQADWWGTKRVESADWFQLVGMVANQAGADGSGTPSEGEIVRIGQGCRFTPSRAGYLYCFANDAWKFYGNNRGCVQLTVRRAA